jgi:hypothetical protein
VGILSRHASGCAYIHNQIDDLFSTGISSGWVWGYKPSVTHDVLIEANDIHDIGQGVISDLGGIYTLGPQPGTVIRRNRIRDVTARGSRGWGIYLDEGSSWIVVEGNLVSRTLSGGFHQHFGTGNVVRDNVFAFGRDAQLKRTRNEEDSFAFVRNIVVWRQGSLFEGRWLVGNFLSDRNCYSYLGDGAPRFGDGLFAQWQAAGNDAHSLLADARFVDPDHDDFTLAPGSPALELGFEPLDLADVGPRSPR